MADNKHIGSRLEDFLDQQGLLEDVSAIAMKRVIAWQIAEAMRVGGVSKVAMAARMQTSRSHLDRLLDSEDTGLTIDTLSRAASALGMRMRFEILPAQSAGAGNVSRKPKARLATKLVRKSVGRR